MKDPLFEQEFGTKSGVEKKRWWNTECAIESAKYIPVILVELLHLDASKLDAIGCSLQARSGRQHSRKGCKLPTLNVYSSSCSAATAEEAKEEEVVVVV